MEPIVERIADVIWHALDAQGATPHAGVDIDAVAAAVVEELGLREDEGDDGIRAQIRYVTEWRPQV